MSLATWIGLGLLVGALAKFIMPGKDPGGLIVTILIGIVGAILGGAIAARFGGGPVTGFNVRSIAISTGGAILLLVLYRVTLKRR